MKKLLLVITLLLAIYTAGAQQKQIDSLNKMIRALPDDTSKVSALFKLARIYYRFNSDSALRVTNEAYLLAQKHNSDKYKGMCYTLLGNIYVSLGDYGKAMNFYFKGIAMSEQLKDEYGIIQTHNNLGSTYIQRKEYKKALQYLLMGQQELKQYFNTHKNAGENFKNINIFLLENLGEAYLYTHRVDSAVFYINKGLEYEKETGFTLLHGGLINDLGEVEMEKGNRDGALRYYNEATAIFISRDDASSLDYNYLSIAKLYDRYHQPDSAILYARRSFASARKGNFLQDVLDAGKLLTALYDKQGNVAEAYKFSKVAAGVNDSLYNQDKTRELVNIDFQEKQRRQDIAAAQLQYEDRVRTYLFIAGLAILLLLVFIFWRNSRQRKRANQQLQKQKEDIEATLGKLQMTQNQLIQSEKMASLGELTAGIAHEIQNPLNFVNNFSEVSIELLDEMETELKKGEMASAVDIAGDVKQNLEKIIHHGKRADGIVKGMLQHTRASSNVKELTDVNKLADEYLRLAYHGLRAKDKSFNADMETHFAPDLPQVSMVPQDIGRVLLNLFNNGFYAVQKKQQTAGPGFRPTVEISTALHGGNLVIKVKDNGNGIPEGIKDKIMQPFFTTKPTGEGTGLGLSLSYDIVVKGHGGKIDIATKEQEYTEFTVSLPL